MKAWARIQNHPDVLQLQEEKRRLQTGAAQRLNRQQNVESIIQWNRVTK